jgi:cyclic pyranopterin monophosphate synthase
MAQLTHLDKKGQARMVNVGGKLISERMAIASGRVTMKAQTFGKITDKRIEKGDVFGIARVAGIMAAKRTGEMIPLCHTLNLNSVEISFKPDLLKSEVRIETRVYSMGRTGVEMEALVATAMAALTIYDMCKAVDRDMVIGDIKLMKKSGGKSGTYLRKRQ